MSEEEVLDEETEDLESSDEDFPLKMDAWKRARAKNSPSYERESVPELAQSSEELDVGTGVQLGARPPSMRCLVQLTPLRDGAYGGERMLELEQLHQVQIAPSSCAAAAPGDMAR